jgi:Pilus formation protein N terminal region
VSPFCGPVVRTVLESAMSILSKHCRRSVRLSLLAVPVICMIGAIPARAADTMTVNVDQAEVMQLPERVATIVIGNPT